MIVTQNLSRRRSPSEEAHSCLRSGSVRIKHVNPHGSYRGVHGFYRMILRQLLERMPHKLHKQPTCCARESNLTRCVPKSRMKPWHQEVAHSINRCWHSILGHSHHALQLRLASCTCCNPDHEECCKPKMEPSGARSDQFRFNHMRVVHVRIAACVI